MVAEAVGLAASVAGLVTLGLQLTCGILKYVDAFESRQKDLDFVREQSDALKATLLAVGEGLHSQGQSGEVIAAVTQSMQSFAKELSSLQELHSDFADCGSQDWTAQVENKKKKFAYAFNRPKIQELGQRLQKASDTLQLALNALGL